MICAHAQPELSLVVDVDCLVPKGDESPNAVALLRSSSGEVSVLLSSASRWLGVSASLAGNARKLRLIYQSDSKHDQLDAQQLARVARMDPRLHCLIEHRSRRYGDCSIP